MIETAKDRAAHFRAAFPDYRATASLDEFRRRELSRLDRDGHVYLDYTGGGLYGESQVRRHMELLLGSVLGNPHSTNPTSAAATHYVESCRRRVLSFFNADPREYVAIFTANASQALKLVGESYPFQPGDRFLLTFDNHNSVNGIREFDRARGAETIYVPVTPPELRVDEAALERELGARPTRRAQSLRLSGAVELLRRAAPAVLDRPRPGAGLGRAARRGGVRAVEPARPGSGASGLRRPVVLQDVRLSDRGRSAARAPERSRQAPPAVVRRRHDHRRLGAGGHSYARRRRGGVRGRHAELRDPAGGRVRARPPRERRHRVRPRAGALPHRLAARGARGAATRQRRAGGADLRADARPSGAAAR